MSYSTFSFLKNKESPTIQRVGWETGEDIYYDLNTVSDIAKLQVKLYD